MTLLVPWAEPLHWHSLEERRVAVAITAHASYWLKDCLIGSLVLLRWWFGKEETSVDKGGGGTK